MSEQRVEELERELLGVQEMLFQVLQEVGEPVVVTKEVLARGLNGDKMISIVEDNQAEAFVFSIVDISDIPDEQ